MTNQLMRRITGLVLSLAGAVLAGVLLAGCAAGGPVVEQTPSGTVAQGSLTPSSADTRAIGGSGGPAPTDPAGGQVQGGRNQPPPMQGQGVVTDVPVWDAAAEKEAINVASYGMSNFALTTITADSWKQGMADYMTPQAQKAWANVRPSLIPVKEILAMATLDPDRSNPYWVWATVPTNDGDYRVQLNRTGAGKPWLIDLIRPKTIHQ